MNINKPNTLLTRYPYLPLQDKTSFLRKIELFHFLLVFFIITVIDNKDVCRANAKIPIGAWFINEAFLHLSYMAKVEATLSKK
ncbi:hypothetical protein EVI01_19500 [Enterococcus villorum]|uniref:Uncharacterized protein n=1 Tax=Enterococcus villorum TaxID=112904 RepID=A0A511J4H0_9ENTE|nr:hypothetical protein EVI01_19500 [Enterococcus villorum]